MNGYQLLKPLLWKSTTHSYHSGTPCKGSVSLILVCATMIEADTGAAMKNCQALNLEHPQQVSPQRILLR